MAEYEITINEFAKNGAALGIKNSSIELALKVRNQAVALCPVDKGQLKNSIMVKSKDTEKGFNDAGGESAPDYQRLNVSPKDNEVFVGTNSDHWYPEFGTRNMAAQPFLRPAIEIALGGEAISIAKKYCNDAMAEEFMKRKVKKVG